MAAEIDVLFTWPSFSGIRHETVYFDRRSVWRQSRLQAVRPRATVSLQPTGKSWESSGKVPGKWAEPDGPGSAIHL